LAFILGGAFPDAVEKGEGVVSGPMTRPMGFAPTDAVRILGVCFRPGGGYRYFRFPAWKLCDGTAEITDLWGATGRHLFDRIGGKVDGGKKQTAIFDRFFLRLADRSRHEDSDFEAALSAIVSNRGQVRIGRLARSFGVSRRQLERKFRERVGMSPKRLCRNLRFKQALKRMDCAPKEPWTEIALACGYYDQAHMINDFKHFTGTTPAAYMEADTASPKVFFSGL